MRKVMKYPIYPIAFSYVGGIFFGLNFRLPLSVVFTTFALSLLLLLVQYVRNNTVSFDFRQNICFLFCIFLTFSSLGCLVFKLYNQPVKIRNLQQRDFTVRIDEVLRSSYRYHRFYATLSAYPDAVGVLGYMPASGQKPEVGAVYSMIGRIAEVPGPKNPQGFDYREYLSKKRIYYQVTADHPVVGAGEQNTLSKGVSRLRNRLVDRFSDLGYDERVRGFTEALLFGVKTRLDDDLQARFRDLGILHVLAVSGMHVILLFGTVSYILRQLHIPQKIITPLLVLFLVVFSLMAGLSGSVLRAVLMCLMVLLGNYLGARSVTLNLLVGSMFLILLFNPNYVFDVGFQLSYLAVFSIVYCYPAVQSYFTFKNRLVNYFSQLIGVSLTAQLGVLPLSIFYFKQVPLLFLMGNIIAIPLTSFLLIAWFVQLALSFISAEAASFFTMPLNKTALFCFESLGRISDQFAVSTLSVYFDLIQTLLLSLMFFCLFWYLYSKRIYKVALLLVFLLLFQIDALYKTLKIKNSNEFLLMSDTENPVFLHRNGTFLVQWGESNAFVSQHIGNYALKHKARLSKRDGLGNAFKVGNESWLVVDSLGVFPSRSFDKVVISQNAHVNLERLVEQVKPKMVVLHSSNRQYLVDAYIEYLKVKKIPYYDMRTKGAYILPYN